MGLSITALVVAVVSAPFFFYWNALDWLSTAAVMGIPALGQLLVTVGVVHFVAPSLTAVIGRVCLSPARRARLSPIYRQFWELRGDAPGAWRLLTLGTFAYGLFVPYAVPVGHGAVRALSVLLFSVFLFGCMYVGWMGPQRPVRRRR